ncbi:hypothetical protein T07_10839 [Trichinella nelsoni]|uniref:Uncharacterized protein n=1 Tax=Trichinella nelsoni TaxID=6336 RepID=A0A0V0RSE9_9BILA|nr:hypothetical protein T07_10839 [Trichinella nelsoni]
MNKTLSLNKLAIDPTAPDAEKEWKFWLLQFQDFLQLTVEPGIDLMNLSPGSNETVNRWKSFYMHSND